VFSRLRSWIGSQRQWHRDHVACWAGWTDAQPDGIARFQLECEVEISSALESVGGSLSARRVEVAKDQGRFVYLSVLPGDIDLWLHCDTVELGRGKQYRRLEKWDFRSPSEMIRNVVTLVLEVVREKNVGAA
jgi:hypothetical protein